MTFCSTIFEIGPIFAPSGGVTTANNDTLWFARDGSREIVLREGDPAPGAPAGTTIAGWGSCFTDDRGDVLVQAVNSGGVIGLWFRSAQGLEAVLSVGDDAPGLEGATIAEFLAVDLGPDGDLAVEARLGGRYWFEDDALMTARRTPDGWRFTPLVIKGEQIVFASNNVRFVSEIGGWTTPNRFGEVLVGTQFRDGAAAVILASPGGCPADFDGNGFVDFFDQIDYTDAFESGRARADFNRDGFLDFYDYAAFLDLFQAGC